MTDDKYAELLARINKLEERVVAWGSSMDQHIANYPLTREVEEDAEAGN